MNEPKAPFTDRLMRSSLMRRGFQTGTLLLASGCRMRYFEKRHPEKRPLVVIVHGISGAAVHFHTVLGPLFNRGYDVIAPDLPGHGFSDTPDEQLTADRIYEGLHEFLEKVAPEPFFLVGNSLGGALAVRYALRKPERLRALVGISPAGGFESGAEWEAFREGLLLGNKRDARRFLDRIHARTPWYAPLLAGIILDGFRRRPIQDLIHTTGIEAFEESKGIPGLEMPVLLIWGRDEKLFPMKNLDWFRRHLPAHAEVDHSDGVGHCPQFDAPRWLCERLDAFLRPVAQAKGPTGD